MGLKQKIIKAILGDVIQEEVKKSSRQIIDFPFPVSETEGIFPQTDPSIFEETYQQTAWVRAVVNVIERAVTARGYQLVPTKPDASSNDAERLQEFFDNCNPNDTLIEIIGDLARDCFIFGNAYVEIVYGADGKPRELWNLDATTMRIRADEHGLIAGYVQVPRYSVKASTVLFEPKEVLHLKLGSKGSTLYGLSPLQSLVLPITCDRLAMVYNRSFFLNGAKIRSALVMKSASPEIIERNREYLAARAKNLDMAQADMILEGDVEFKQISVAQKDMEFLELRKFVRDEILAVYGVPPSKISAIESGNLGGGTGEHQTMNFYEETVTPFQTFLAAKITKLIIRQGFGIQDWSFQFTKRPIDEKEQAEIFNLYIQNGVFTAEEVRRIVSPRMPDIEKSHSNGRSEIEKGRLKPNQTIVEASRAVVEIENRFVRALENQFRKIKATLAEKIPSIVRGNVTPKIEKLTTPFESFPVHVRDIAFRRVKFPEAVKQLSDLEVVLELIDSEGVARVIRGYSLEAANKALELAARRNNLKDIEDISAELKEILDNNALNLAGHISESIKASVRQALIEGLAKNETIQDLQARVEAQIDSFATVNVRPVTDANGNVIRTGHTRGVSRSSAAEAIARTEANRAFNEGNLDALEQADIASVQFLLASDACPECVAVAESVPGDKLGKTLSLDDARGVIPVHPNCRCTWVAP